MTHIADNETMAKLWSELAEQALSEFRREYPDMAEQEIEVEFCSTLTTGAKIGARHQYENGRIDWMVDHPVLGNVWVIAKQVENVTS